MGIIYIKNRLDELYKERDRINKEIQECKDELKWYDETYKDSPYYQKHGVPFDEVHDYSP